MRTRTLFFGLTLLVAPTLALAAAPKLEPQHHWYEFRFYGKKVGFFETVDQLAELEGQPAIHSTRRSVITVRRGEHELRIESVAEAWAEPESGRPLAFRHVQKEPGGERRYDGRTRGDRMLVETNVSGNVTKTELPISKDTYLAPTLDVLFKRRLADGKTFQGHVISEEDGSLGRFEIAVKKDGKGFLIDSVFRFGTTALESREWVRADGVVTRTSIPKLGAEMTLVDKASALQQNSLEDIYRAAQLSSGAQLPEPPSLDRLVVFLEAKDRPVPVPVADERQQIESRGEKKLRLAIQRVRAPSQGNTTEGQARFLAETAYESLRDPALVEAARAATTGAANAWDSAKRINRFVFGHIRDKSLARAFNTASEALASRQGDCTEHAVLFSALAKIAKIPTRLVTGLVYVGGRKGVFGYHEWVEVWIGGRWIPMDPTFGQELADPTHIKFTQGLSDADGLRDAGMAAAQLFSGVELRVAEYTAAGQKTKM